MEPATKSSSAVKSSAAVEPAATMKSTAEPAMEAGMESAVPTPTPINRHPPGPGVVIGRGRIIPIRSRPIVVINCLAVRDDIGGGRRWTARLRHCGLVIWSRRLRLLRLLLLLLGGGRGHCRALIQHRINDPFRHSLLFQINYLRRIESVNRAGVLDITDDRTVADFCL